MFTDGQLQVIGTLIEADIWNGSAYISPSDVPGINDDISLCPLIIFKSKDVHSYVSTTINIYIFNGFLSIDVNSKNLLVVANNISNVLIGLSINERVEVYNNTLYTVGRNKSNVGSSRKYNNYYKNTRFLFERNFKYKAG